MSFVKRSAVLTAGALLFVSVSAFANDEALPADRVVAAIQTAVASNPGLVKDVEVEREKGKLFVDVEIIGEDGRKAKVRIDPEKNERVNR